MTLLPSINKNWFLLITCIFTHNYESCENGKLNIPWFILMPCMMLTHLLIRKDKNMKPWFLAILNMHEHLDENTSRWSRFLHGRGQSTYKSHPMPLLLFTSFTTKEKHSSPNLSWPATLLRSTLVCALHMLMVVNVNHKPSIHPK
jgi:hypothetical protein